MQDPTDDAPINESPNSAPSDAILDDLFTYHKPDDEQIPKYEAIRNGARVFAQILNDSCPPSADRTAAMRQLQDTVMTANRSIALNGRSYR